MRSGREAPVRSPHVKQSLADHCSLVAESPHHGWQASKPIFPRARPGRNLAAKFLARQHPPRGRAQIWVGQENRSSGYKRCLEAGAPPGRHGSRPKPSKAPSRHLPGLAPQVTASKGRGCPGADWAKTCHPCYLANNIKYLS